MHYHVKTASMVGLSTSRAISDRATAEWVRDETDATLWSVDAQATVTVIPCADSSCGPALAAAAPREATR
jgi:hypothetical protein